MDVWNFSPNKIGGVITYFILLKIVLEHIPNLIEIGI